MTACTEYSIGRLTAFRVMYGQAIVLMGTSCTSGRPGGRIFGKLIEIIYSSQLRVEFRFYKILSYAYSKPMHDRKISLRRVVPLIRGFVKPEMGFRTVHWNTLSKEQHEPDQVLKLWIASFGQRQISFGCRNPALSMSQPEIGRPRGGRIMGTTRQNYAE